LPRTKHGHKLVLFLHELVISGKDIPLLA
jgi:hypothetical protein